MLELTDAQRRIFQFIEREIAVSGAPPTLRTIQAQFGFKAIGTVQDHLKALIRKGFLIKEPVRARGVTLSHRHRAGSMATPILGTVAAGYPQEAIEHIQGTIPIPDHVGRKGTCFALRVKGDSMIDAGIMAGDVVIVRKQSTAKDGEIVVAMIDGEATVKRLEKTGTGARLLAANPKYSPIPIPHGRDVIQGKVVGVQRYYE